MRVRSCVCVCLCHAVIAEWIFTNNDQLCANPFANPFALCIWRNYAHTKPVCPRVRAARALANISIHMSIATICDRTGFIFTWESLSRRLALRCPCAHWLVCKEKIKHVRFACLGGCVCPRYTQCTTSNFKIRVQCRCSQCVHTTHIRDNIYNDSLSTGSLFMSGHRRHVQMICYLQGIYLLLNINRLYIDI